MTSPTKVKVIPKDQAVFWLDRHGRWHNQHGPFEHDKIIAYFNSAIKRDAKGYYLYQKTQYGAEKVYFSYEDCVLFAIDILMDEPITLVLNTGRRVRLRPQRMFVKDDDLYMNLGEDRIKFSQRCLVKISEMMIFDNDHYHIKLKGKLHPIASVR